MHFLLTAVATAFEESPAARLRTRKSIPVVNKFLPSQAGSQVSR